MSISLKNHEDRIKALENSSSANSIQYFTVYHGPFRDAWGVPYIYIPTSATRLIIDGSYGDRGNYTNIYDSSNVNPGRLSFTEGSLIPDGVDSTFGYRYYLAPHGDWWNNSLRIRVGLKIYYIFRYNIIPEFIRSINYMIDKITHNFTSLCLKIQGGEIT